METLKTLKVYRAKIDHEEWTEVVYEGIDESKAISRYNLISIKDVDSRYRNSNYLQKVLECSTITYKSDGIDDEDIYYLFCGNELSIASEDCSILECEDINPINAASDLILHEVQSYYKQKYHNYKYNVIAVYNEDGEEIGCIQLRISNHTENVFNYDRYGVSCDHYLSVVIADEDPCESRRQSNEFEKRSNEHTLYFNSEYTTEEVIQEIENYIEELKEKLLSN